MYHPQGYKQLLTWKQAGEIYQLAKEFTDLHLDLYRDSRLISHINDSGRSVQRNIEEGYKRNNTQDYLAFLRFSHASNEELKRDLEELKRELEDGQRWDIADIRKYKDRDKEIIRTKLDQLITLTYGEDCMLGRQIRSLEKQSGLSIMPEKERIYRARQHEKNQEELFWQEVKEKFGIDRDNIRNDKDG